MNDDILFELSDKACIRAWENEGWGPYHKALLTKCMKRESMGFKRSKNMTQVSKILLHILKTGHITQREAYIDYSIQNFSGRMSDLKALGFNVKRTIKEHPTTYQQYSSYTISNMGAVKRYLQERVAA